MKNQIIIGFKELRISCKIGILEKEKINDQDFLIDLEVHCNLPEKKITHLEQTIDYCILKEICESLVKEKQYDLLETYAQDIEKEIGKLKGVCSLKVCIKKMGAFAEANCGFVALERIYQ